MFITQVAPVDKIAARRCIPEERTMKRAILSGLRKKRLRHKRSLWSPEIHFPKENERFKCRYYTSLFQAINKYYAFA